MDSRGDRKIGLTLSGGGFRATLFHLGVVRFLYETGWLEPVKRIGAVSGGSILAAHLVLRWDQYVGEDKVFNKAALKLIQFLQDDIRGKIVRHWFFAWISLIPRFLVPKSKRWTSGNLLQQYYQGLFNNATLKHLRRGGPDVALNCTSLSTGSPCSFTSCGFFWYDREEEKEKFVPSDEARVAFAVAASSAFPPLFPPIEISNDTLVIDKIKFPHKLRLTDGGVYDNLGIDRFITNQKMLSDLDILLISDAEGDFDAEFETSYTYPVGRNVRASDVLMTRVSSLQMDRLGSQQRPIIIPVSIKGEVRDSNLTPEKQRTLPKVRTDLDAFTPIEVIALIVHGFCKARDEFIKHGLLDNSSPLCSWDPLNNIRELQCLRVTEELRRSKRRKWRLWSYRDWSSWASLGLIISGLSIIPIISYIVATQKAARDVVPFKIALEQVKQSFPKLSPRAPTDFEIINRYSSCDDPATLWYCQNGGLLSTSGTTCDDASWGAWGPPSPIKICKATASLATTFYVCSKGGIGTSPNFCDYVGGHSSSTLALRTVDSTCARPQTFFVCVNGGAAGTSGNFCYYKNWGPTFPIALCTAE